MRMQVDVFVVGLGPGGGAAAWAAAAAGLRVLAVDRRRVIGHPVQCAEFIPLPMSRYASAAPLRVQLISGMKSFLPSGAIENTDFPGLIIDRAGFDAALCERAQLAGAQIRMASSLKSLDAANRVAVVDGVDGALEIEYQLLIAADGPHSTCAKALGLSPLKTVNTRQYAVPLRGPYVDTDIWVSDEYPGGYAWLFPKGDVANLGLGADKRFESDLKSPLDRLHLQLVKQGLVGAEILSRTGGAIPVGGLRERLVVDRCVFVGDAGGFTHPITGAGIASAVISGERAGAAAAEFLDGQDDALAEYDEDMRDQYGPSLARAVAKRTWLDTLWRTPLAQQDAAMRGGWIAFDEYFAESA